MMPTDCIVLVLALMKWRAHGVMPIDRVSSPPHEEVFGLLRGDRSLARRVTGPIVSL